MTQAFEYNSFPANFCEQVLDLFREKRSVRAVSAALPIGEASVFRLLNAAVDGGALSPQERDLAQLRREAIQEVMQRHPHATMAQVAQLAGVSEATVYRAKRGE